MTPYMILGVSPQADDATIRRAYLELVKKNPPDHNPAKFSRVNAAFELIKDQKSRIAFDLFDKETGISSPMEAVTTWAEIQEKRQVPTYESLQEYLRKCLK